MQGTEKAISEVPGWSDAWIGIVGAVSSCLMTNMSRSAGRVRDRGEGKLSDVGTRNYRMSMQGMT